MDLIHLKNMSILLVEDNPKTLKNLSVSLQMLFANVYTATNGWDAFIEYKKHTPDFLLTDISMPFGDGLSLIEEVRNICSETAIIILTGYSTEDYLLKASNLQIDGYLIKPTTIDQLLEPIFRALRRIKSIKTLPTIANLYRDYYFDMNTMELSFNENKIPLGKKEAKFLSLLCQNQGVVVSKQKIAQTVWENEYMSEPALKNLISSCRKKIDKNAIICTPGIGWLIK